MNEIEILIIFFFMLLPRLIARLSSHIPKILLKYWFIAFNVHDEVWRKSGNEVKRSCDSYLLLNGSNSFWIFILTKLKADEDEKKNHMKIFLTYLLRLFMSTSHSITLFCSYGLETCAVLLVVLLVYRLKYDVN